MNEPKSSAMKGILQEWAEEAVPSDSIHLWTAIQSSLNASTLRPQEGKSKMQHSARKPSIRWAVALAAAVLIILVILTATPQGQVLSSNFLNLLKRPEGSTAITTPTTSIASTQTLLPTLTTSPQFSDDLTIAQAESLAGFRILTPDKLPRDDFHLHHASYSATGKTVCLMYGNSLSIAESQITPLPAAEDLFQAGLEASVSVPIGGSLGGKGTLMKGGLNPNQFCVNKQTFSWGNYSSQNEVLQFQTNTMNISIYAQEIPDMIDPGGFVTRMELIRLAEAMTGVQTIPDNQPDPEFLQDGPQADTFAGFHIQMPTLLFGHEALSYIRVYPENRSQRVEIMYQINLVVNEISNPTETLESLQNSDPKMTYQSITVHGQPGLLWAEPGNTISIYWFENGIEYSIWAIYDGQPIENWVTLADSFK